MTPDSRTLVTVNSLLWVGNHKKREKCLWHKPPSSPTEDTAEKSLRKLVMLYLWSKELPRGTRISQGKKICGM